MMAMEQVQNTTIRDVLRSGIGVPIGVLSVLAMLVLPLPPLALDILFTFNIALSLVVMMAVFYVARPLEFSHSQDPKQTEVRWKFRSASSIRLDVCLPDNAAELVILFA